MPFEFGDVVLVPFPFTSQRASKKRPAVAASNRAYSTARPDLIVMSVTSRLWPNPGLGDAWVSHWRPPRCSSPPWSTGFRDPRTKASTAPARPASNHRDIFLMPE